jgi:hypothetical protein
MIAGLQADAARHFCAQNGGEHIFSKLFFDGADIFFILLQ